MSKQIPGSMPRACDATYRGYLTSEAPKRIALEDGSELVKTRMGVYMAASHVTSEEDRNQCVEWLNVVAMSPAQMERLERCQPRELICVTGPVTLRPYKTRNGESRIDRSVIAEYVRSASASMPQKPKEVHLGRRRRAARGRPAGRRRRRRRSGGYRIAGNAAWIRQAWAGLYSVHTTTRAKPAGLRSNGQGSRQRTRGPCPSTIQPRNASDPNPPETAVWGRRAWRDRPGTPACAGSDRCPARAT